MTAESPALRRIRADARIAREARDSAAEFSGIVKDCADRFIRESRQLSGVGALYLFYRPSTATAPGQLRIGPQAEDGEHLACPERVSMWITLPEISPWVAERSRRLPILPGGAA